MLRTAHTENGSVQGLPAADPRITTFKGIPFAAPPVGENRWRAPQPCHNWDGVQDAFEYAPISVQDTPGLGTDIYCREWHVDANIPISEDSLYLNVWTSAKDPAERLPVLVFFFGGVLQWGYTSEMEIDGERIARRGVIVVTVNYRLAALGFLAHPEITAEQPHTPGNFGNLDQQAGLRWVKRNIASFGGDPDNITVAGQSAGGFSVMAQMACIANEGLFHKAIVFSGMIRSPYATDPLIVPKSLRQAEQEGVEFFNFLGVQNLSEARKLDALCIRNKYAEFVQNHPRFMTFLDGSFCKEDPFLAFVEHRRLPLPVLAGNTSNEFIAYVNAKDNDALQDRAKSIFGEHATQFLHFSQTHIKDDEGFAPANSVEIAVKTAFRAEQKAATPNPCYYYRFNPDIPGNDHPGAFHSSDLWFFFETLAKSTRPFRGKHYELARQMCNYISNFAKSGDPNGPDDNGTPMPAWQPYNLDHRAEMIFGDNGAEQSIESNPYMSFLSEHLFRELTKKEL
ncbi:MAG TPA: carboxylesterase family protein [Treponemataceae bacterium]|nr:carboxylesterase family protein [Treponemataceae bacterium]